MTPAPQKRGAAVASIMWAVPVFRRHCPRAFRPGPRATLRNAEPMAEGPSFAETAGAGIP